MTMTIKMTTTASACAARFAATAVGWRLRAVDPRWLQIAVLTAFICYARIALEQRIGAVNAIAAIGGALFAERLCAHFWTRRFDARSALITGLSLTLLLRSPLPSLVLLAALGAIAAKYVVRVRGKQVFNPSNIAIVAVTLVAPGAWISTGQWGQTAMLVGAIGGLGFLVCARAARLDLALTFCGLWSATLVARAIWLGDPLAIPLHQMQDGTLLIFAFFMITDPRATPDHRLARVVFAVAICAVAYYLRFVQYQPDGVIRALALVSPLTPLLDRWRRAARFQWQAVDRQSIEGRSIEGRATALGRVTAPVAGMSGLVAPIRS